ncbi:FAD-dependent oxidoreductase [Blastococcus saxobsidens]|uniref:Fumarate reductase/succinate dehydrogenase flavoprotein-like protein n=1 Tax=Blastococcus saxobsidens (strain DD2) TaxID=1146883 RepID=H6RSY8_BLASD|nr:FAD-dependent oxidoreductase [Blastococcus saxobsidens]CCG04291.1 Fumarate reductase/succinate dehydrogenase flavoprotein-like protein [Blastococcus saxobsidens DD2]
MSSPVVDPVDVVVVGAGMAGLCASVAALERGARVLVIEKGPRAGGSMFLSGGLVWTFTDKARLRKELPDGDEALQDLVMDSLGPSLNWLESHGIAVGPEQPFMWYGRGRRVEPPTLTQALVRRVAELGGGVRLRTPMLGLMWEGCLVRGVEVWTPDGSMKIPAGRVVLATGGFQGNAELLARYVTPYADRCYVRSNPWSTGDGLVSAQAAGAALSPWLSTFYGHAVVAPPARFAAEEFWGISQRYGQQAVALNLEGRRFVDESAGTGEEYLNQAVARQPGATAVYLVDRAIAEMSLHGANPPRPAIDRAVGSGGPVLRADTLEAMCDSLQDWGIPATRSLETLRQYNAAIGSGSSDELYPPRHKNRLMLVEPPFTAVQVRPGITFTCGGLATDTDMRVLHRARTNSVLPLVTADASDFLWGYVENLYAAGSDVGGVHNYGYMGGLATALVTGRIAGS